MDEFRLDFVGVGAVKAGTTWLAECLGEHPQVCVAKPKELNFFCTHGIWHNSRVNRGEGTHWLQSRFSHWETGQIRGEISPAYLVDPSSPRLIKEHCSDVKILISYRNPTDSLYSLYYEMAKYYSVPESFEEFLEEQPDSVQYGCYFTNTKRYLDYFPFENIHFIVFDDICDDSRRVLRDLFQFLGVGSTYLPASFYKRINERRYPRYTLVRDFVETTTVFFRGHPWGRNCRQLLRPLGAHRIARWLLTKNLRVGIRAPMRPDTRLRLMETYAEENNLLGDLIGRDFSKWNES